MSRIFKIFFYSSILSLQISLLQINFLECKNLVLFAPDDHPTDKILELINSAQKKIHAAVYMITDKNIAQALIDAKNKGVDVQIVTDKISLESKCGKVKLLEENNIKVLVFQTSPAKSAPKSDSSKNQQYSTEPIMHNKFALFDDKEVVTGSFNWTRKANQKNQENLIVTDQKEIYEKYEKQFEILKQRCTSFETQKDSGESTFNWKIPVAIKKKFVHFLELLRKKLVSETE